MHLPAVPKESQIAEAAPERTTYVWGIAVVAALGGLLFGYDWVVIGGARQFYEIYFHLTSAALVGWANSCALVGCLFGSLIAGVVADSYGRRRTLLAAAVLFGVSSVFTGWAHSFDSFIVWRILGGTAIGLSSNVSPLYIAEVSPAAIRGRLVSLNQFAIVVGILMAQVVNWAIARPIASNFSAYAILHSWNVQYGWRWMFTVIVIPAVFFTIASLFLPESPRWLLAHQRETEASRVLARIGGQAYAAAEIIAIQHVLSADAALGESSWRELLRPGIRRMLFVGVALAVLQQWTGINTLFNYASDVYRKAGHGANEIFVDIVITGTINLLFTVVSMLLVDRVGRRIMMLLGCFGIGASHILCAFAYRGGWSAGAILTLTLAAIACYALTLAPVTWVLISEIFPNRVRSHGVSVAVSALWIASFLLTYTFPTLNASLGTAGVFFGYGAICLLGSLLVWRFVPETKGRTLEQIEHAITGLDPSL
jgi:MFS transporter, SP family, xylose:H+ symportor